ncbi:EF-hand calcium-binding domain-containing protein 6 [Acipenser ruthenus]|uniref:EF-hand calcium-binding domain-containing protein 6 n=1 Tax=Acipenser ruthenus TaxID=7906 RepID=A0A444UHT3_ACIRT|nr:EF-hand calcium-binding domain-containing protein 6 [Acipenser ruthenus]
MEEIANFSLRSSDIWIVTYPKSGTSLLQEVVYLVSQGADPDEIGLMNIDEQLPVLEYPQPGLDIIQELTSPRLIKSHLPYRFLPTALHNGESKMIYMARNPKDLVVSYYQFHRSLRTMSYRGTFQEFCRRFMNDKLGYGSWFEHVQEFWEHRMDSNVLFLKYEDMYKDLATLVEQLARFLGVSCDKAQLETMVESCHQLIEQCSNSEALSICRGTGTSVRSTPDPSLSMVDIERILQKRTPVMQDDLRRAFQVYDVECNLTVTKGEFRSVVESFLLPLTEGQFEELLAKVPMKSNGSIPYMEFLKIFCRLSTVNSRCSSSKANQTMTLSEIQYHIKEKVSKNLKNTIRAFRLFDYNRDGHIQKHEFRRVIESYCFQMTNKEFSKLWSHFDVSNSATVSYTEFLQKLGLEINNRPVPEGTQLVLNWKAVQEDQKKHHKNANQQIFVEGQALDDTERVFRKNMRLNKQNVLKALQAFDDTQSGFVSFEDLKCILSNFVISMNDATFKGLMNRFGFKATGKIAWEQFLAKFKDPVAPGNGQTVPVRSNHRVSPIRGADEQFSSEDILLKLQPYIQTAHTSLRKAFLVFDDDRNGNVTRLELRRILDSLTFRMTNEQFEELMALLDPEDTDVINYHRFLELFEAKKSPEGHKWLNRHNETQQIKELPPAILTWETVEGILYNKITDHWREIQKDLKCHDPTERGTVSQEALRRILHTYAFPVSDDHFNKLCQSCKDSLTGGVFYRQFLDNLGIVVRPGDLTGVSTQVFEGSHQREEMRQADLTDSLNKIDREANHHTKKMTVEELLLKLKEKMAPLDATIKGSFLACCYQPNGKMTKKLFKKVLDDCGLITDDEHFQILTDKLGFKQGEISYSDFLMKFEDHQVGSPGAALQHTSNHHVNGTKTHFLSAEQCLIQFVNKLHENFTDLYCAFYKADRNRDGIMTMHDFRELVDSFMLIIKQKEFLRMLGILGLGPASTLNYPEFCDTFQIKKMPEAHPWIHSRHRYDTKGKGYITHSEFLEKLGVELAPADNGPSFQISEENNRTLLEHNITQQEKHKEIEVMQINQTRALRTAQIEQELKDKFRDNFQDFSKAFNKLDKKKDGYITVQDFYRVLLEHSYNLNEDQFTHLLVRLGIGTHDSKLAYFDFLRVIDDGRASKYGSTQVPTAEVENEKPIHHEALEDIKKKVTTSFNNLQKAFAAIDKKMSGALKQEEFRRVLDSFCFRFSDSLFTYLLSKIKLNKDNTVDWIDFMQSYSLLNHESTNEWLEKVQKASKPLTAKALSMTDILTRIHEVVSSRLETITKEIKDIDYAQIDVISKEDFRRISNQYFMRLTDEQFEDLWNRMAVNDYGNLEYCKFLKRFSGDPCEKPQSPPVTDRRPGSSLKSPPASAGLLERSTSLCRRPKTAPSALSRSKSMVQVNRPFTAGEHSTPLLNCESIEQKVKRQVCQSWKKIYKQCRERDAEGRGEISVSDFLAVMEKFETKMTLDEFEQLALKYNIKNNGKFSYPEFLQHFVLTLKPQDGSLLQRMKISQPRIAMSPGNQSSQFVDAMLTIQGQVLQCWKPMRRHFKAFDEGVSGYISVHDFRQVLRKYSVNLSEDDFFHIVAFYDKKLNGKISYNDFLRAFLR